jgi:hypothetical protein
MTKLTVTFAILRTRLKTTGTAIPKRHFCLLL